LGVTGEWVQQRLKFRVASPREDKYECP
jgi:hypothetical protein